MPQCDTSWHSNMAVMKNTGDPDCYGGRGTTRPRVRFWGKCTMGHHIGKSFVFQVEHTRNMWPRMLLLSWKKKKPKRTCANNLYMSVGDIIHSSPKARNSSQVQLTSENTNSSLHTAAQQLTETTLPDTRPIEGLRRWQRVPVPAPGKWRQEDPWGWGLAVPPL